MEMLFESLAITCQTMETERLRDHSRTNDIAALRDFADSEVEGWEMEALEREKTRPFCR